MQGFSKQYSHTEREVLVGQRRRASLVRNLRTARNRKLSTPGRGRRGDSLKMIKITF